jgi:hypothetical protein
MTWEHEKTFEAALAQPDHPWRGAALAFEPELRRLRELVAWQDDRMEQYARTSAAHLNSLSESNARLRARVARLEEYIGDHWNAFDADELRELMAKRDV